MRKATQVEFRSEAIRLLISEDRQIRMRALHVLEGATPLPEKQLQQLKTMAVDQNLSAEVRRMVDQVLRKVGEHSTNLDKN